MHIHNFPLVISENAKGIYEFYISDSTLLSRVTYLGKQGTVGRVDVEIFCLTRKFVGKRKEKPVNEH